MRLLLLLSALLAALSGATVSARAPQAQVVEVASRLTSPVARPAHAHVLLAARPAPATTAEVAPVLREPVLRAAPRLWMQRRRE